MPPLTPEIVKKILLRLTAFRRFSDRQIELFSNLPVLCWEPGAEIFHEGVTNTDMVVLLRGKAAVEKRVAGSKDRFERINEVESPAILGENAFFTSLPSSVTIRADGFVDSLQVPWLDFFRLEDLGRSAIVEFLRTLGNQNVLWVEQQAERFLSTLTLMGGELRKNDLDFFARVVAYKSELSDPAIDPQHMKEILREICLLLREVNESLGNLYHFAHFPDVRIESFDPAGFRVERLFRNYHPLRAFVDQVNGWRAFMPLPQIQVKHLLVGLLLEKYKGDRKETRANYKNFLKKLNEVYTHILTDPASLGLELKRVAGSSHVPAGRN